MDYEQHTKFKNHPFIKSIANIDKWSVTMLDNKMPVDMFRLMTYDDIRGASFYDYQSLTTRQLVEDTFARVNQIPPNYAFYLETSLDGFMILDIEPTCPQEIKERLLKLPFVYGEKSMSGKGYHLIFHTPDNYLDYPVTHDKPALKEDNKYYEILLNHFCTFTGNIIDTPVNPEGNFADIFQELAAQAKEINKQKEAMIHTLSNKPDTEKVDYILQLLRNAAKQYRKKPQDFCKESDGTPDMSRYEWSFICFLYKKLDEILSISSIKKEHTYTDEEQAYFLYTIACEVLEYRPKHDSFRNSSDNIRLPWLGYLVKDVMEKIILEK